MQEEEERWVRPSGRQAVTVWPEDTREGQKSKRQTNLKIPILSFDLSSKTLRTIK